jgi:hypothetical protein
MTKPISVQHPSVIHGGLLDHARTVEVLRAAISLDANGQIVGIDEAATRLLGSQPPHIRILSEVAAERQRQIDIEGWSEQHDDAHDSRELFAAGAAYLNPQNQTRKLPPKIWPWEAMWWKAKGYRRNFVRGMALLVAGVERDRRRFPKSASAPEI